jgi:hypothetical protein
MGHLVVAGVDDEALDQPDLAVGGTKFIFIPNGAWFALQAPC